jgi:hypothetical protein
MTITDPVQLLIAAGAISTDPFAPDSRYRGIAQGLFVRDAGDPGVRYVLRRFIPQRRDITIVAEHIVHGGERPDMLAALTLADAELYWRVADANAVIDPNELTDTIGARVNVPTPPGL